MHIQYTPKEVTRFWSKVDRSGGPEACWPWLAGIFTNGYGQVRWQGKIRRAHRVAYELMYGPISDGMNVCHTCDNKLCCNSKAHFFLGTQADNVADMRAKGRVSSKLTWADVTYIREQYAAGLKTKPQLMLEKCLSRFSLSYIIRNKRWRI
jgi:hypothetical protein